MTFAKLAWPLAVYGAALLAALLAVHIGVQL